MKSFEDSRRNSTAGVPPAEACGRDVRGRLPQIEAHAATSTGEVCGFVYPDKFIPLPNLDPRGDHFYADPRVLAKTLANFGEPEIIFHSHPNGNLNLSAEDLRLWYYTGSTMMIGCMFRGRLRWKIYGNRGD